MSYHLRHSGTNEIYRISGGQRIKDPLLLGLGEEVGGQPMSFLENIGKTLVH